jgi:hypothetical protein
MMAKCVYCNSDYSDERAELGFNYCMADSCHNKGLSESRQAFLKIYTPALLHKSNYFWTRRDSLTDLNVRADLDR